METQNTESYLYQQNVFRSFESIYNNDKNIRSYKRRFWMLFLFCSLSLLCGAAFPQYVVMANINMCFYGVGPNAINWTCLIFMVVYIVLVFPVSYIMGRVGLRTTVIIGSIFNTLSYAVQFATHSPGGFPYVMLTSFIASLSNVFVLAIPPSLAAVWFPSKEVSRTCAMGVVGNQLGQAAGFIVPPLMISSDCERKDLIAEGKKNVSILFTSLNAALLLLIIFTFENEPKYPPSIAQAEKKDIKEPYLTSALKLAKNINFVLVFLVYGLIIGTSYTITTLLNDLLVEYFSDVDVYIGWMGVFAIAAGAIGSTIAGYILDYTHRFKETSIAICFLCFFSYIFFSCGLVVHKLWLQFVTIGFVGFIFISFLPVGFEYGIEVTYPESEITSASLLNSSTMLFGIIITEIASSILQNNGPTYCNGFMNLALLIGAVLSCFITKNYKRSQKNAVSSTF